MITRAELSVEMSALEVPEVDEAVFTEDEEDYDDEAGNSIETLGKILVELYFDFLKRFRIQKWPL